MDIRVQKLAHFPKEWDLPQYATDGSACFDLRAVIDWERDKSRYNSMQTLHDSQTGEDVIGVSVPSDYSVRFSTELAFEIPKGYVMLVFSRSGHGFKRNVKLANCVGVIDSDYRGEVKVALQNDGEYTFVVTHGMAIAQAMIVPVPEVKLVEATELSETTRGENGFGSTGA